MLLESIDQGAVREGEIIIQELRITGLGFLRPCMFVGSMVEHEIQNQAYSPLTELGSQLEKVFHGSKVRVDGSVVVHRIATVIFPAGNRKYGHQMQIGHPQLFKIRDMIAQP